MSGCKKQAIEVIDRLHSESRLEYPDYCTIHDGLDEIDTLRDRDEELGRRPWTVLTHGCIHRELRKC